MSMQHRERERGAERIAVKRQPRPRPARSRPRGTPPPRRSPTEVPNPIHGGARRCRRRRARRARGGSRACRPRRRQMRDEAGQPGEGEHQPRMRAAGDQQPEARGDDGGDVARPSATAAAVWRPRRSRDDDGRHAVDRRRCSASRPSLGCRAQYFRTTPGGFGRRSSPPATGSGWSGASRDSVMDRTLRVARFRSVVAAPTPEAATQPSTMRRFSQTPKPSAVGPCRGGGEHVHARRREEVGHEVLRPVGRDHLQHGRQEQQERRAPPRCRPRCSGASCRRRGRTPRPARGRAPRRGAGGTPRGPARLAETSIPEKTTDDDQERAERGDRRRRRRSPRTSTTALAASAGSRWARR